MQGDFLKSLDQVLAENRRLKEQVEDQRKRIQELSERGVDLPLQPVSETPASARESEKSAVLPSAPKSDMRTYGQ